MKSDFDIGDVSAATPWQCKILIILGTGRRYGVIRLAQPFGAWNGQARETLADDARQGKNDFGKIGYGGPSPPPGKPHRYYFKLYALDTGLDLPAGSTKDELLAAMKGHVLAEGQLMGRYGR